MTPKEVLALMREKEVKVSICVSWISPACGSISPSRPSPRRRHLRGRPRLRRLQHPRLAGDQRVRHARHARPGDGVHRSVFQGQDPDDDLQYPGSAHQGRLHARSAQRGPQGRQLHEVHRHRRHRLLRPRAGILHLRRHPLRPDAELRLLLHRQRRRRLEHRPRGEARTSATSCATRKAISPCRPRTRCTTSAPR